MGIGSTIKGILKDDTSTAPDTTDGHMNSRGDNNTIRDDSSRLGGGKTNAFGTSGQGGNVHRLPPGTGPGTSGKPATDADRSAMSGRNSSGLGQSGTGTRTGGLTSSQRTGGISDTSAASGITGTQTGITGGTGQRTSNSGLGQRTGDLGRTDLTDANTRGDAGTELGTGAGTRVGGTRAVDEGLGRTGHHHHSSSGEGLGSRHIDRGSVDDSVRRAGTEVDSGTNMAGMRTHEGQGTLPDVHRFGHNKADSKDIMPSGETTEDSNQLNPVTHERVRHLETEEVRRQKDKERHIHHVQHHTQPILHSEELPEQHHEKIHPVTHIHEKHANKVEDNTLFDHQIRQHHDTVEHGAKERNVIDAGTIVNEQTHHHVHHVIQPIIEKETFDKHRIHTVIPTHEVTHEAPVIHQSQTHAPVQLDHFLSKGGALTGAFSHDQIGSQVLHGGQCTRDVDGIGESLARDLHLGSDNASATGGNYSTERGLSSGNMSGGQFKSGEGMGRAGVVERGSGLGDENRFGSDGRFGRQGEFDGVGREGGIDSEGDWRQGGIGREGGFQAERGLDRDGSFGQGKKLSREDSFGRNPAVAHRISRENSLGKVGTKKDRYVAV